MILKVSFERLQMDRFLTYPAEFVKTRSQFGGKGRLSFSVVVLDLRIPG
jgi:hypothetical protein